MLPINEFILWNNCSNNCKFCWQKKEKQQTLNEHFKSIKLVKEAVKELKASHVLFVGGEIFDNKNKDLNNELLSLFDLTTDKMLKGDIELLYINTNILYDIDVILMPVLNLIQRKNLIERVHFTTSGDENGRFSDNHSSNDFYANLQIIRDTFPKLLIYVNIILTKSFCENILSEQFNINDYESFYKVEVNTIPYIKFGKEIEAPTRNQVFKTLIKLDEQLPGYLIKYCNNFLLNQDIILRKYENDKLINISSDKSKCTHSENFTRCYSDSNECFVCDCGKLKELMESKE